MKRCLSPLCVLTGLLLGWGSPALAQTTIVTGAPELDPDTGELSLLVGGTRREGSAAPVSDPHLIIDGGAPRPARGIDKLVDYASEHPKWTPPVAVGVIYQWSQGTPQTMVDGLEALFRHLPSRMTVYPTPYGQGYRPVVTKVTASRAAGGELAEYAQLPGDQLKLAEAVRFNVPKLLEDAAPLKFLFVVTDGRATAEGGKEALAALGEELRRAGLRVTVLAFPAPTDAADAADNARALADAAGGRLVVVEKNADLSALTESLAEAVTTFDRVRYDLPWPVRTFGGQRKLVVRGTIEGASHKSPALVLAFHAQGLPWGPLLVLVVLLGALLAGGGLWLKRRGDEGTAARQDGAESEAEDDVDTSGPTDRTPPRVRRVRSGRRPEGAAPDKEAPSPLQRMVEEILRTGLSPDRALVALSRAFGADVAQIGRPEVVMGWIATSPLLGSEAGKARLRDMAHRLASPPLEEGFLRFLAPSLATALRTQTSPSGAAARLRLTLAPLVWSALLRATTGELRAAMDGAQATFPEFRDLLSLRYVQDVAALLAEQPDGPAVVAWLVQIHGPQLPGTTSPLPPGDFHLGGAGSDLVIGQGRGVSASATLHLGGDTLTLTRLAGETALNGAPVSLPADLGDGAVLQIGLNLFVVRINHLYLPGRGESAGAPGSRRRDPGAPRHPVNRTNN